MISRGEVIVRGGAMDAAPGRGAFLPCARPDPAPPVGTAVAS